MHYGILIICPNAYIFYIILLITYNFMLNKYSLHTYFGNGAGTMEF